MGATTIVPETSSPAHHPVASYIHTAILVMIMVAVAIMTAYSSQQPRSNTGPTAFYVQTLIWLWLLFGFTVWAIRRNGTSVRDVIAGAWNGFDDFLMDLVVAGGFWFSSILALGLLRFLFSGGKMPSVQEATKSIGMLAPHSAKEIVLWIALSISAGICEEFVFRGYLQRQFTALTKKPALGVILSAACFSVGHLYQGGMQMLIIGVYGAMLGALALFRKSLRPGMMAHAWQDILSGLMLSVITSQTMK